MIYEVRYNVVESRDRYLEMGTCAEENRGIVVLVPLLSYGRPARDV
jgi:hypothetical protein